MPYYRVRPHNTACAATALAQCISVQGNEPIKDLGNPANARRAGNVSDKTSFRKKARQQDDGVRAHHDFAFRRYDMQFAKTRFQVQVGMDCRQYAGINGVGNHDFSVIQDLQPGNPSLANLTLLIVDDLVRQARLAERKKIRNDTLLSEERCQRTERCLQRVEYLWI